MKGHIKGVSSERTFFARPLIKAQIKGHIGGPKRACIGSDDDDVLVAVSDGSPWLAGYGKVYAGTFFV